MTQKNDFLGKESIGRLLLKMSAPAIAAQLINLLYNMVDRIFIGHIKEVGTPALTGVGVCMPIIMVVSAFAALVSNGGAPQASMELGKKNVKGAERILGNCFVTQVVLSLALTILLLVFHRPVLMAFGASNRTISYAVDYMRIYALGTIFVQLTLGMNSFITGQGFAKEGMLSVLIGAVCNIILDPILIYGCQLGVKGAALATVISQGISTIWVLSFLRGKKTVIRLEIEGMKPEKKIILSAMALGLAPFIMQASESIIIVCFNSSLLKYGGDVAVGAMTILSSVLQFAMLPMQGLGQGAQPITSYNFGAGKLDRVRKTFRLLLKVSLGYSFIIWAAVMAFPMAFAGIFTADRELVYFTGWALRIYIGSIGIFGAQMACQMTFIAIGNAKLSIIVAVMRKFVLLMPLIFLLPHMVPDKTLGVYLAEPVSDFISVVFTVILFSFQFRKSLAKREREL